MHRTSRVTGIVAGLTLSLGALAAPSLALAAPAGAAPCAQQQAQVDRAEAALERVTAVFEGQQGKATRPKAAKAKKAQVQRVAKAQERLAKCEAAQPVTS